LGQALLAVLASLAAMGLQQVARQVWQIRTLPERVMEWLLLFVPLDLFERGLQRFGANAKEIAQAAVTLGMAGLLAGIGVLVLRAGWSTWRILGLGLVLWFLAMGVIMPVTGAGLFATGLLASPLLTNAGYLLVFLGYAVVLALARLLIRPRPARRSLPGTSAWAERRALLTGLAGTLLAYGVASLTASRGGGGVQSSLPLAAAPTLQPTPLPAPPSTAIPRAPAATGTAAGATRAPTAGATSAAVTQAAGPPATPTAAGYPTPPPVRGIARDQDGSLTAAGRPPGTLAPPITSNADFYIVTKNAVADPVLDAASWRLIIDGEVERPVQLDYPTLRALPSVEITKTLECISNLTAGCSMTSFGCDLISTARWRGARLGDVLDLAGGLKSSAVALAFIATDEFSSSLPPEVVSDPSALVVYEMNGAPLPREHGYPARLLVPGRYGMKNPKWLARIQATSQPYADWYQQRGWTKDGFVKTMSRIDVPADGTTLAAGPQRIAGVAYAGDRGIQRVDVSADGGRTWQPTTFVEPPASQDAMVRWQATFEMPAAGTLTLVVRATDGSGAVQPEDFGLPAPDGGWGQDSIDVSAA